MDQLVAIREELARRKIVLDENWPARDADDVFHVRLSTLPVANKSDLDSDPDEVKVLEELLDIRYPAFAVSATTGDVLELHAR